MSVVKICGLRTPETLEAALAAGADMVGFVRFPRSPRHVELDLARDLSQAARGRATRVVLLVDPTDAELDAAVASIEPDLIQLHGGETPLRCAHIRALTGRPVMKALGISKGADLAWIEQYWGFANRLLLDAKPPKGAVLPGGNGVTFDWRMLKRLVGPPFFVRFTLTGPALEATKTFMLSGGLTSENVGEAIRVSGLHAVDVSSGVESAPGVKDPDKIAAFIQAARTAFAAGDRRVA